MATTKRINLGNDGGGRSYKNLAFSEMQVVTLRNALTAAYRDRRLPADETKRLGLIMAKLRI